jgi:hypothetical protein
LHAESRLLPMIRGEVEEEKYDYDLIVIGGGSGGLAASKVMAITSCFINKHIWMDWDWDKFVPVTNQLQDSLQG